MIRDFCIPGPSNKLTRCGLSCLFKGDIPNMRVSDHGLGHPLVITLFSTVIQNQ